MEILRSVGLFVLAAVAEIGGAWLVWQGVREHRGIAWIGAGIIALGCTDSWRPCSPTPTSDGSSPPTAESSSAGSLAWGMALDGFKPDRYDVIGAIICLVGVGVIMYSPRTS